MDDRWRVRRGGREKSLRDADELNRLAAAGAVRRTDRIFNPVRNRWVEASSVPEILGALATAEIRKRTWRLQMWTVAAVLYIFTVAVVVGVHSRLAIIAGVALGSLATLAAVLPLVATTSRGDFR